MNIVNVNAGLSKVAKEEHARDLPIMNGIKEIIKSVEVLDSGCPHYRETLYNLSTRLNLFEVNIILTWVRINYFNTCII